MLTKSMPFERQYYSINCSSFVKTILQSAV